MAGRTLLMLLLNLFLLSSTAYASIKQKQLVIPPDYQHAAYEHGVPASLLYAVVMQESGAWPWTLNVAGTGYYYKTRQQAENALEVFMRKWPLKRIDAGIAQINLGYNGYWFTNYHQAFEPDVNLRVAAQILKSCYRGDWILAAGCYHHPAGGTHAAVYREGVKKYLAKINGNSISATKETETAIVWITPQTSTELACACIWILPEK